MKRAKKPRTRWPTTFTQRRMLYQAYAIDALDAMRGSGQGYPKLSRYLDIALALETEDRAGCPLDQIGPEHPCHRYLDRSPSGALGSITVETIQQVMDLARVAITENQRGCAMASALVSIEAYL